MIKIIETKPKVERKIKRYRVECKHCRTIFECDDTDFRNTMIGHGDYVDIVRCPICHEGLSFMFAPWLCEIKTIEE